MSTSNSSTLVFPPNRPSRTKIVATLGPASDTDEVVAALIKAGVDVFRLNMAHGGPEAGQKRLERVRSVAAQLGLPIAIHADLAGPKMRLGEIPGGEYLCTAEIPMKFVRGKTTTEPNTFTTTYQPLIDDLDIGDKIMLADGTVALEVAEKDADSVTCTVLQGGPVRSRQGVNLPGAKLSVKTLQPEDIINARWAATAGVDYIGVSFVRCVEDIHELREILKETILAANGNIEDIPHIIPKIEKPEAIEHLEEIVDASDGVMVARGDLGVELDIAQIAIIQKRIIEMCRRKAKPVIVATQMLESMHHLTIPTRAEATDVANAILDGADACMLSGETAVGDHPVKVVEMMHRIAVVTEKAIPKHHALERRLMSTTTSVTTALCDAAVCVADDLDAALILIASRSGSTALHFSNKRCMTMTLGMSPNNRALNRMCLYWGVIPVLNVPVDQREFLPAVVEAGKNLGYLESNDKIVLVGGTKPENNHRNFLYVHVVD
ncbi:MAG: pyruvate kinase [Thermoguttaceae bacterium]